MHTDCGFLNVFVVVEIASVVVEIALAFGRDDPCRSYKDKSKWNKQHSGEHESMKLKEIKKKKKKKVKKLTRTIENVGSGQLGLLD